MLLAGPSAAAGAEPGTAARTVLARRVGARAGIRIDGLLKEDVWREDRGESGFRQRRPRPGAVPPVSTTFWVAFDEEYLYFAARLDVGSRAEIISNSILEDDPDFYLDESIVFKLDVANDKSTTRAFGVTAANRRTEFIVLDNGKRDEIGYDVPWESATVQGDSSWTVEARLPLAEIGVTAGDAPLSIGMQVTRNYPYRGGQYDWVSIPPEYGGFAASRYGTLTGLEYGGGGGVIGVAPFVRFREMRGDVTDDLTAFPLGADAHMRVGRHGRLQAVVNSDFTEADLDEPEVNFNRFPLFLPERREFFTQGLDVFDFGEPGESQLFFSRRIGLSSAGTALPTYGGLKTYGRSERFRYGFLDVVTGKPNVNWAVGRINYRAGDNVAIGLMGTRKAEFGQRSEGSAGFDCNVRLADDRFVGRISMAGSGIDDGFADDRGMLSASLAWLGRSWQPGATLLKVGPRFAPETGFVRRTDLLKAGIDVPIVVYTGMLGLEKIVAGGELENLYSARGERSLGWSRAAYLTLVSPMWTVYASTAEDEDVVEDDFTLLSMYPIRRGTYRGARTSVSLRRSSSRNPSGLLGYIDDGNYFGGRRREGYLNLAVSALRCVRMSMRTSRSWISIPEEPSLVTTTVVGTIGVLASDRTNMDLTYQYSDYSDLRALAVRGRTRFASAGDAYFGYVLRDIRGGYSHEIVAKIRYRFSLRI